LALAIAWGTFAACSSFDSAEPSSPEDGGTVDAADGALVVDAGTDVEAGRFCESLTTKPTLCVDFDEGDPVDFGFEAKTGDVSVDLALSKSPPASMRVAGRSFVERYFPGDSQSLTLSFQVWVGGLDGGPPLNEFGIVGRIIAGSKECSFDIAAAQRDLEIQVVGDDGGRSDERHALVRYPVAGEWKDVTMRLIDDDAGVTARVDIAGGPALDEVRTTCPDLKVGAHVDVGLLYEPEASEVRIDNVVFNRN